MGFFFFYSSSFTAFLGNAYRAKWVGATTRASGRFSWFWSRCDAHQGAVCHRDGIGRLTCPSPSGIDKSPAAHKTWGGDTKYWKLKNSWGPAFGEGGYFRFKYGNVCMRGACKAYIGKPPSP